MPLNKVTALALVILVTSPVIARAQSISIEKLVLTGEFVDDPTIDTRYDSFDPAVYSDSGHVLVHTTIKGTDAFMGVKEDAIVLLQPGVAPRIVAREWRPLEGLSPTDFVDFLYDEPQISPQGEVAFFAGLRSQKTSDDRTVLVWFDGADYYELAAFDGQVPGQPAGVTFERIFKIQSISGQLAVHENLNALADLLHCRDRQRLLRATEDLHAPRPRTIDTSSIPPHIISDANALYDELLAVELTTSRSVKMDCATIGTNV